MLARRGLHAARAVPVAAAFDVCAIGGDCHALDDGSMLCAVMDRPEGGADMKNPLESLPNTVLMGLVLTVIMVAVLAAIG